jgi:hypothetical protein
LLLAASSPNRSKWFTAVLTKGFETFPAHLPARELKNIVVGNQFNSHLKIDFGREGRCQWSICEVKSRGLT